MDQDTLALLMTYRYWIILPLAFFEGPLVAIMIGFLSSLGYFSMLPAFLILSTWDCARDLFLYYMGRFTKKHAFIKKYGESIHVDDAHIQFLESLWNKHTFKTMLFGKFAFGLSAILLMTSGLVHLPIVRFMRSAFLISFTEYGLFLLLGYYFGGFYEILSQSVHYAGYVLLCIAVIIVSLYFYSAYRAKAAFLQTTQDSQE